MEINKIQYDDTDNGLFRLLRYFCHICGVLSWYFVWACTVSLELKFLPYSAKGYRELADPKY